MPDYEKDFEKHVIDRIEREYPGAISLKQNPNWLQGVTDRVVLYGTTWFAFDLKRNSTSPHRPNQEYYINLFNQMSFADFLYPENETRFFRELQRSLRPIRSSRLFRGI